MNKKILSRLIFGASLLLLAACTKDEAADPDALPEGKYPLQIASVAMSVESSEQPWTRVSEKTDDNSSVWETGDVFYVKFDGYDDVGKYRIKNDGTVEAVTPIYWHSTTQSGKVTAWYISPSATTNGTVDLSNQSKGLAYVLRAEATTAYSSSPVALNFKHQLSKVRVYLRGTAYEGNAMGITMNSYPASCTVANGEITASGTANTIAMHPTIANGQPCFEANVPTGTLTKGNAFTVTLGGGTSVQVSLNDNMNPTAANLHTVTLRLQKNGTTEVDLSKQAETYEITNEGIYYFTQSGSNTNNYGIKVNAENTKVYLDGVNINVSSGNGIEVAKTATIYVQSNNNITASYGAGISVAENATVTITSAERNSNKLTAIGGDAGAGIGGYSSNCGNIYIKNVTVNAYGSNDSEPIVFSPGIGGSRENKCGFIIIDNAIVYACGTESPQRSGAAIGAGIGVNALGTYSYITIKNNSEVNVRRGNQYSNYIGHSGAGSILQVTTPEIDAKVESSKVVKLN